MRSFVTELIVLVMYGELLRPPLPVTYFLPVSSFDELYMLVEDPPVNPDMDPEEQAGLLSAMKQMISFLESPLVQKKIDRISKIPWAVSKPVIYNDRVTFQFVNAHDTASYGDELDPIETELIEIAIREGLPLLTEDPSLHQRIVDFEVPVQVFDVDDFEFALEEEMPDPMSGPPSPVSESHSYLPLVVVGSFLALLVGAILTTIM